MHDTLTIKRSDQINEIIGALAKAQGEMKPAVFNRVNPHYKNRYADFTSCMEAVREPLSKNGLAISQMPATSADGKFVLVTLLAHISGQWMAGEFPLIPKNMDSQGIGSAMTYAKRYSLCGMTGMVADEEGDDDGETAVGRGKTLEPQTVNQNSQSSVQKKDISPELLDKRQILILTDLIQQLDEENQHAFPLWIKKAFNVISLQEIPKYGYEKCLHSLNAKIKYLKDQQKSIDVAV